MTKYKKAVAEMLEYNHDLFLGFKKIHDQFMTDPDTVKDEFNLEGEKVLRVVRRYENQLCNKSESGKFGKYSENLSEKFWEEVRTHFPKIDHVGMR
jgi:hypothetical protein